MILAVHYRRMDEPKNTVPGCWKEFTSQEAARNWLQHRKNKTATSAKGDLIIEFFSAKVIEDMVKVGGDIMPVSCRKALENYLRWKAL